MDQRNTRSTNRTTNSEQDQRAQLHPQQQSNVNRALQVAEPTTAFVPHHQSGNSETTLPYGIAQYNAIHHHLIAANPGLALTTPPPSYYNLYAAPPGSSVYPPRFFDGFGGVFKRKIAEGYYGNFQYGNSVAGPSSAGPSRPGPAVPTNAPWLGQQDGSTLAWGQAPAIPYMQGNGVNSGFPTNFQPHPPPMYPQSLHHLPQHVQLPFYPQAPNTSYVLPRNNALHANMSAFQVGTEVGPGYVGPVPPGVAVYNPSHGRGAVPGATLRRHHALPRVNFLSADEIAMLELPSYYEMVNAVDHHMDMRMDVDNMSYEELLALEEHIGSVMVGLSVETISKYLKTKTHIAPTNSMELDDQETEFCTICQNNYEDKQKIGTLDCGHEYHVDCIKKWLLIKNTCPICKSSALTTKKKDPKREG